MKIKKYLSCHHQDSNHFGSCGMFDYIISLFTALTAKTCSTKQRSSTSKKKGVLHVQKENKNVKPNINGYRVEVWFFQGSIFFQAKFLYKRPMFEKVPADKPKKSRKLCQRCISKISEQVLLVNLYIKAISNC